MTISICNIYFKNTHFTLGVLEGQPNNLWILNNTAVDILCQKEKIEREKSFLKFKITKKFLMFTATQLL